MGNSCRYYVCSAINFLRTSVSIHASLVGGTDAPSSSSHAHEVKRTRRQWIVNESRQYFMVNRIHGRLERTEKCVVEVGRVGYDKRFILKKQPTPHCIRSEFLALSIAGPKNPHMLVPHEFFSWNGVHYFVYEKEDTDMFTIMSEASFSVHRRRPLIKQYIRQMILAVQYMHSHDVVHYDLKFENMVVNLRTHQLRLIDFECCKEWNQPKCFLGTEDYMAPEIFLFRTIPTYEPGKQDIWSMGMLLSILLVDKCITSRDRNANDFHAFIRKLRDHPIVSKCLQFHPKDRVNIHELLSIVSKTEDLFAPLPTNNRHNDDNQDHDATNDTGSPENTVQKALSSPSSSSSTGGWDFGDTFPQHILSE